MWTVSACLAPAGIWGVAIFGLGSLFILMISIASAMLTEFIITRLQGRHTLSDGSAFLTGLLIGYNMPPSVPAFIPVIASVFAIAVVKQTFGGLGRNWMNPALAGRVFVLFSWTPQADQAPSNHTVTIRVTDNGTPPLSAARTFQVSVHTTVPLEITGIQFTSSQEIAITWNSVAGSTYHLESSDRPTASAWVRVFDYTATGPMTTAHHTIGNSSQRYYRVVRAE